MLNPVETALGHLVLLVVNHIHHTAVQLAGVVLDHVLEGALLLDELTEPARRVLHLSHFFGGTTRRLRCGCDRIFLFEADFLYFILHVIKLHLALFGVSLLPTS